MTSHIQLENTIPLEKAGGRLDQIAAELFPEYSRGRIKNWLLSGEMTVNGTQVKKANQKVSGGERLVLDTQLQEEGEWQAENIPLDIVFEDAHVLVLNKPVGIVVHPAAGNWTGTVLNGLLHHHPDLINIPRAGIVHRLDKDTSGLMVVAKSLEAQNHLVNQLQARSVKREYEAVCWGVPEAKGRVEGNIGRHPTVRTKMAVLRQGGKEAATHYQVLEDLGDFAQIRLQLETGRTHQIRVHMAHIGHSLLGDPMYGRAMTVNEQKRYREWPVISAFSRQALHAAQLGLIHPVKGEPMQWSVPLPEDMQLLIRELEAFLDDDA